MSYGLHPSNPWGAWVREWRRMKFQTRKRYNARNSDVSLPALPPLLGLEGEDAWQRKLLPSSQFTKLKVDTFIFYLNERCLIKYDWKVLAIYLHHNDKPVRVLPQRGRNSCLWLQSRSVLSPFDVVLMSCRVNALVSGKPRTPHTRGMRGISGGF